MFYTPIALLFLFLFAGLFALVMVLIQIGILQYAFETMGVSRRYMFGLLLGSLLGSYVNIPIAQLHGQAVGMGEVVDFYGMRYVVPVVVNSPGTVLAVNVGGAVIPFLLSLYLMKRHRLYGVSILAIAIVTVVVHWMAQPVRGVGIAVPIFIPPVITAIVAITLWPRNPAPLAYIAGSMGTLIGADLLNLNKVQNLGAPVASIGGAGKFDGIFLTGLLAVLLAGLFGRRRRTV
jgi:uncharacterized membrane protein